MTAWARTTRRASSSIAWPGAASTSLNSTRSIQPRGAPLRCIVATIAKILVVDGRIAFTGGVNIQSVYGRSSASIRRRREEPAGTDEGWRDTHIEIRGPAVAAFQRLFLETWRKQDGPPLPARDYFPTLGREGRKIVQVIGSSPDDNQSVIYLTLLSAITNAVRSVYLTTAYFVPDRQVLDALIEARRRGVDVKLALPGITDHTVALHAGRSHYSELLDA